jgi:hypothetical protein
MQDGVPLSAKFQGRDQQVIKLVDTAGQATQLIGG